MIEIKARIIKVGDSYYFTIPKALVDCQVLPVGRKIRFILDEESLIENPAKFQSLSFRLNSDLKNAVWVSAVA